MNFLNQTSSSASPRRRLHLGHFAFMRAVVQGLEARSSWERYLRLEGEYQDIRRVRHTIAWIRDEFAAAARREHKPGTSRLVLMDVATIPEREARLPDLQSFSQEMGASEFSEKELTTLYAERYGTALPRLHRRARLIAKQLAALRWLESLLVQAPQAKDGVGAWLHPALSARLQAAGLHTLSQLIARINGSGLRWWRSISGIGATKGLRIVQWLRDHESSIGLIIGPHVDLPRSQLSAQALQQLVAPATAIVPLEKFVVPAALNGEQGLYRAPQHLCLMGAHNDYDALMTWLRSKTSPHTRRAYRKEAERFLLWAIVQKNKPLSSMTLEDCLEYRDFLLNPSPADRWCGLRNHGRWSPLWRPFEGPLTERSQRQALTVLRSLYAFLVDQSYLLGNPWNGVAPHQRQAPKVDAGRSFSRLQWTLIHEQLKLLPETGANRRLRFALQFLYATGLRASEIVAARLMDLHWVQYPADVEDEEEAQGWLLTVLGKGNKPREVPVDPALISLLRDYLAHRGLNPDFNHPETKLAFLLGKADDARDKLSRAQGQQVSALEGISSATLYEQIKSFFAICAEMLEKNNDHKAAARFRQASTHWLRHTHGAHAVARGVPIEVLQVNLGHASINTTTIYTTSENKRRLKTMHRLWQNELR